MTHADPTRDEGPLSGGLEAPEPVRPPRPSTQQMRMVRGEDAAAPHFRRAARAYLAAVESATATSEEIDLLIQAMNAFGSGQSRPMVMACINRAVSVGSLNDEQYAWLSDEWRGWNRDKTLTFDEHCRTIARRERKRVPAKGQTSFLES